MDLLYVLGPGSVWQDNELRYSLRSVTEYLPHTRVVVSGYAPYWLQNVEHISIPTGANDRVADTWNKVCMAVTMGSLTGDFLLMNDDFLVLQAVDHHHSYSTGTVYDRLGSRDMPGTYRAPLFKAYDLLRACGIPHPMDYETHHPLPMHADGVREIRTKLPMRSGTYAWRTMYANHFCSAPVITQDVKQRDRFIEPHGLYYSYGDTVATSPEFRAWCAERWPIPCRYER